jgi:hypothetical protein
MYVTITAPTYISEELVEIHKQGGRERTNFCWESNSGVMTGSPVHYTLSCTIVIDKIWFFTFPIQYNTASGGSTHDNSLFFIFPSRPVYFHHPLVIIYQSALPLCMMSQPPATRLSLQCSSILHVLRSIVQCGIV